MPNNKRQKESIIVESLEHKMNFKVAQHGGYFTDSGDHASADFKVTAVKSCWRDKADVIESLFTA